MAGQPNDTSPPLPDSPDEPPVTPPANADEWQRYLSLLPVKDVLRLLNEEKARANRIFVGFRPGGDALKNPRVLMRLIEEATKQPKFAESLLALAPKPVTDADSPPPSTTRSAPGTAAREIESLKREVQILRDSLDKRKATIQEKEMEIRELKAALSRAEHERDLTKQTVAQAQEARAHADAEAARLRHQLRREERREENRDKSPAPAPAPMIAPSAIAHREMIIAPAARPSLLAEAVERLLRRARYAAIIDLCREALNADTAKDDSAGRGQIHAFYAAALYGQGQISAGEEQSRLAITSLLDGGEITGAAEAAARFLAEAKTVRKTDAEPLRRLILLARRAGVEAEVHGSFRQLRLRSRTGYQRMIDLLGNLAKSIFAVVGGSQTIGPDEIVVLPTYHAGPLTPRRIVQAVAAGETNPVIQTRNGLAALRTTGGADAKRAEALLEAIAALEPVAVEPLLRGATHPVIVDASNVARFNPDPLALSSPPHTVHLRLMRDYLLRSGFFPIVMIADASLIHFVDDRADYQNLVAGEVVQEVPAGTSADDELIRQARLRNAPIVTNDTFSDQESVEDIPRLAFHIVGNTIGLIPR